jgi:hypothetical protein
MKKIKISGLVDSDPAEAKPFQFNEMATSCHPKDNGGKYLMWIRVEYTDGEHSPPHAHLYEPNQRPSRNSLITKFKISDKAPTKPDDIEVMPRKPPVPFDYAWMIIRWAREKNKLGINNWTALRNDWLGLEKTFN